MTSNQNIHGKIIVHDRNRVQSEVLPVYFNHASFASLRRQLSYFSFVRVGKSRQSGVTYTNDAVVELSDILRLKRRAATAGAGQVVQLTGLQAGAAVRSQLPKRVKDPQEPQPRRQHQQQQQQEHLANVSADIASAVLSGKFHAAKTNHNLESKSESQTSIPLLPLGHRRSTVTSYAESSMSQSSDNDISKDSTSKKNCGGNDDAENNGSTVPEKKKTKKKSKAFNKRRHHQRASSSMVKFSIAREDRARFERLLSVNVIVPFIHLPAGHSSRRKKKSIMVDHDPIGGVCSGRGASATKENMAQLTDRATSDAAINALLALGSDCQ
ncbi:hypothetical protein ACHAW5_002082 [Stephanodiscus triporus]|uniref:HSF-type DNA-binding domain-containing protein n=1 Tax=Stephanodiscus triporus TaxID=2934178 RepID=A0ABD3MVM2_9STRA